MGRKRHRRRDDKLPPYVNRVPSRDRVVWREYLGEGRFGRYITLKDNKNKPLLALASVQVIWEAYKRLDTEGDSDTLRGLFNAYFQSPHFQQLAVATRRGYRIHADTICAKPLKNNLVFGDVAPERIKPPTLAKYRDKGVETPVATNRQLQFMSAVFSWAVEQGRMSKNPAKSVRKLRTKPRDRYIDDDEFAKVKEAAGNTALPLIMELQYLLRTRVSEVLTLKRSDVLENGVLVRRTKGSESEITTWTPRLQAALKAAERFNGDVISPYLIHDRKGLKITYGAARSAFVRALEKAGVERFTLHDIKAKGITDHKHHAGGHRSARMREVYVRMPDEVESTR